MSLTPIIIDHGSHTVKAGFSHEDLPSTIVPAVVSSFKNHGFTTSPNSRFSLSDGHYVGEEALSKKGLMQLDRPIKKGVIVNVDQLNLIWDYIFNRLGVEPYNHPVVLCLNSLTSSKQMSQIKEIMCERYQVPSLDVVFQPMMSLFAAGKQTGVVVDCGYDATQVTTIINHQIHNSQRLELGGKHISNRMLKMMVEKGVDIRDECVGVVNDIKERLGFVARDFNAEVRKSTSIFALPPSYEIDGEDVEIENERFCAPEILFKPKGIQHSVHASISKTAPKCHHALYSNIVLAGGSSMLPNFPYRLKAELLALSPYLDDVGVLAPAYRMFSSWVGASIFASVNKSSEEHQEKRVLKNKL